MNNVQDLSASLIGAVTPFVVALLKAHIVKVSDTAAHFLSLAVAGAAVTVAMVSLHIPFTWGTFGANLGIAFTLSQTVFQSFKGDPS